MKRYDNIVLNKLLESYENSSAYRAERIGRTKSAACDADDPKNPEITAGDKCDEAAADRAPAHRRGIFCRIDKKNFPDYFDEASKSSTDMESFKSNLERDTAKKVGDVLEKIVGKGNVSVQVNADIDFNSAKSTIESYIPVEGSKEGVLVSSQTEVETYENPNQVPNPAGVNQRNLNYSKQKTAMNYNVTKEVKQVKGLLDGILKTT